MLRLAAKTLMLLPAVCGLAAFNYAVDPWSLFRDGCEGVVADSIVSGDSIRIPKYVDDRLVQVRVIERLQEPPDLIALGSSRGMQIRSAQFAGRFLNHSVSAGKLEDFLALYQNYVARNLQPQGIVLELDPWTITKSDDRPRYVRLEDDYRAMCRLLNLPPRANATPIVPGVKYLELLSPNYFQSSLGLWLTNDGRFRRTCDEIRDPTPASGAILADGSIMYPAAVLQRSRPDVRRDAVRLARSAFSVVTLPGERAQRELEAFLSFLLRQGVQVVFVLPPFHPAVTDAWRATGLYTSLTVAETYFRSLADRFNLTVLGSYDAGASGCSDAEFVDGLHPTHVCLARILSTWTPSWGLRRQPAP